MIPLRVCLQGFMSYRDIVTFDFAGAPLWVIVGPNGAGKSAIFDAILYALYGAHRGGRENARALINQQSNSLNVEFDFELGSATYRAKRTLAKKGNPTCGIYHLNAQPTERIVPGTDKEKEFDTWVAQHIGLDEQSFTAAVLLQQGKSEALLNAQPKDRHQILSQLVDISRYERLAKRAEGRQKHFEGQAEGFASQLKMLGPVNEDEIDLLAATIQEWKEKGHAALVELEELARLQVHCENWMQLEGERTEIEGALKTTRELSDRAAQIEQDAERWQELNVVLPRLRNISATRQRIVEMEQSMAQHTREAEQWRTEIESAAQTLAEHQKHDAELHEQHNQAQLLKAAAQDTLVDLAPDIQQLDHLDRLCSQAADYESKLAEFPADLDAEYAALEEEIGALEGLRTALPYLETFARARARWQDAQCRFHKTQTAAEEWAKQHADVLQEKEALTLERDVANAHMEGTKDAWTTAKAQLSNAQIAMGRFQQVEGTPTCLYCGQALTPTHLDQERDRLKQLIADANTQVQQTQAVFQDTSKHYQFLQEPLRAREGTLGQLELEMSGANQALAFLQDQSSRAENEARAALQALPAPYLEPFAGCDGNLTLLLKQPYPSADELSTERTRANQYEARRAQRTMLQTRVDARTRFVTLHQEAVTHIQELQAVYPDELGAHIRNEYARASREQNEADQRLAALAPQRAAAERGVREWEAAVKKAEAARNRAQAEGRTEEARCQELVRVLDAHYQELAAPWHSVAETLDDAGLNALQEEHHTLADAPAEWDALREARAHYTARTQRLGEIERAVDVIPNEAKRPRSELDKQAALARERRENADHARNDALHKKQTLESRRSQQVEFEKQRKDAAHRAHLYKELAQLLGRDHLQRHLLQQAEANIVRHANHTLDRLSGGKMRLELRPLAPAQAKQKNKSAGVKALDLVAYNRATGQEPLPVYLLSGSQRFRVVVSMALGIGQWRGAQTHDAVIIDEGFGSLDKEGRRQMVDELHKLTQVLGRILLVSHQEEFADAFVNRYIVELHDGTSCARLAERDE